MAQGPDRQALACLQHFATLHVFTHCAGVASVSLAVLGSEQHCYYFSSCQYDSVRQHPSVGLRSFWYQRGLYTQPQIDQIEA